MYRYCEEYRTDLPVICSEIDIKVNVGNQVPILEMYVIDNNGMIMRMIVKSTTALCAEGN